MNNPLELIKVDAALRSEYMKLEYRQKTRLDQVNILDYTVIAALEKQIPEKLKVADVGYKIYGCPNCDYTDNLWSLNKKDKYCPNCGQKLDWSVEE